MTVDAAAWTTLAAVREYLNLPTNEVDRDTFIENLINRSYKVLEAYIGKTIKSATYTEYYDGDGTDTLLVDQWPIISITSLNEDVSRDFLGDTAIDATDILIYAKEGRIVLYADEYAFSIGKQNIKIVYVAGYADIPADLALAALMHVSSIYNLAGADGHVGMSLGGLSKSIDTAPLSDKLRLLLEPYRKRAT